MYIQVKLLNGFKEPLLYRVPSDWQNSVIKGSLVRVPLKAQSVTGYVEEILHQKPITPFAIREALSLEIIPCDEHYIPFIMQLANYYQTEPNHFFKRLQHFLHHKEIVDVALESKALQKPTVKKTIVLTPEQESIVSWMNKVIEQPVYTPVLLHGVTGSGKTEVYKKLIEQTIALGKTALLLLPEVTLALQFKHILQTQLDEKITVASFHSAVSAAEKKKIWHDLLVQKPMVIIGVHLPLLLPIARLGLIIIDEEHDTGYQEKKHPKVNSKEAALMRAQLLGIPILLGSATPSISSLYNSSHKKWHFFQLKQRFSGIFPTISIISMLDKKERKNFWISNELAQAIAQQLKKREQTLIFLNRRGYSFFVQCKACSFIFYCLACSVSLTLHENNELMCHYCGYKRIQPPQCDACRSSDLLKKGIGTQQIVTILQKLFPAARITRADHDTTVNKKKWHEIVTQFYEGSLDILVGTQTITKGYHFPKVSLVGILWADLNLHFPIYNALETTLQQLIQVAGRAGRTGLQSQVIVQTMADHHIYAYLDELSYLNFYHDEFETRKNVGYPPAQRLAEIELKHHDEPLLEQESQSLALHFKNYSLAHNLQVTLLGPSKPPVSKLKNTYMRKIYIKSQTFTPIFSLYRSVKKEKYASLISFTPNPLT